MSLKINKKTTIGLLLIIIALMIFVVAIYFISTDNDYLSVAKCETHFATYDVIEKNINDKKVKLLVADTETKRNYGPMNIKSKKDICGYDGMIFVFDNPGVQAFWNQNTLVDLKLYWMLGDKILRSDDLQNITDNGMKIYSSILPVNRVVEIVK